MSAFSGRPSSTGQKAKENRASVAGGSLHSGGSITQVSTIDRMTKELDRIPTLRRFSLNSTHAKVIKASGWTSALKTPMFKERLVELQAQHAQAQAQGIDLPPIDEDVIWEEVCGGIKKN
ncbi:hypothetical protein PIB30_085226 [Stylosanthes scabra]|uniref:Uncharacterized protein n=1 Tax=Stylosanthes scabra TaxID=79078 RepID=A0ABU6URM7_9FABA|nr:hypothetical protein [Stylosanthes scabra]